MFLFRKEPFRYLRESTPQPQGMNTVKQISKDLRCPRLGLRFFSESSQNLDFSPRANLILLPVSLVRLQWQNPSQGFEISKLRKRVNRQSETITKKLCVSTNQIDEKPQPLHTRTIRLRARRKQATRPFNNMVNIWFIRCAHAPTNP